MTYQKVGEISEACREYLLSAVPEPEGHKGEGTDYASVADLSVDHPELRKILPREWVHILAVNIPPGGNLHPHRHGDDIKKTKYHVVLSTNDDCESVNGGVSSHLELRGVYRMEPRLIHESFNRGETDRLHLIIEMANV